MQIVATARLRTALIIAVRDYERDCITPRVRKRFGTPETVKPRIEGYVDAIKDIFPEIPGISFGSSFELEVRNVICRNVGRIDEQTRRMRTGNSCVPLELLTASLEMRCSPILQASLSMTGFRLRNGKSAGNRLEKPLSSERKIASLSTPSV